MCVFASCAEIFIVDTNFSNSFYNVVSILLYGLMMVVASMAADGKHQQSITRDFKYVPCISLFSSYYKNTVNLGIRTPLSNWNATARSLSALTSVRVNISLPLKLEHGRNENSLFGSVLILVLVLAV